MKHRLIFCWVRICFGRFHINPILHVELKFVRFWTAALSFVRLNFNRVILVSVIFTCYEPLYYGKMWENAADAIEILVANLQCRLRDLKVFYIMATIAVAAISRNIATFLRDWFYMKLHQLGLIHLYSLVYSLTNPDRLQLQRCSHYSR